MDIQEKDCYSQLPLMLSVLVTQSAQLLNKTH